MTLGWIYGNSPSQPCPLDDLPRDILSPRAPGTVLVSIASMALSALSGSGVVESSILLSYPSPLLHQSDSWDPTYEGSSSLSFSSTLLPVATVIHKAPTA